MTKFGKFNTVSLALLIAITIVTVSTSACSIHRLDIQQGNVFTEETLHKLSVGMEQNKVRLIAGTPLIQDPFSKDRWDYVYTFRHGITDKTQYSYVTLLFANNILVDIKVHSEPLKLDEINSLNRQLRQVRS